jgi:hypothetical protein
MRFIEIECQKEGLKCCDMNEGNVHENAVVFRCNWLERDRRWGWPGIISSDTLTVEVLLENLHPFLLSYPVPKFCSQGIEDARVILPILVRL